MPFLRFSRDKRGYENTYVLHGFRSGDRTRPRVLYWFRTPPNVKVGRLPLDEEAIRAIEESNPDLAFDWTKMLRVRPNAPRRPTKRTSEGGASRRPFAPDRSRPRATLPAAPVDAQPNDPDDGTAEAVGLVEGDADVAVTGDGEREVEWRHPVAGLIGDDALARIRARYAELRARLAEKRTAPNVRDAMEARVEALNPDGWREGEAIVRGIEHFEANVEEIKQALGRRPRRRRGGASRRRQEGGEAGRDDSPQS